MHRHIHILPCIFIAIIIACMVKLVSASHGDRSDVYQSCMKWCSSHNCSNDAALDHFVEIRPWHLALLSWECKDECQYQCMWHTVSVFQKKGHSIPQFHGKWPFVRFLGIQEPASAVFSVFNGLSHLFMWQKFRYSVPSNTPTYSTWKIQAFLSMNAWLWSTIFHARDTPLTEKLDYYCAFSLVLYTFYTLFIKLLGSDPSWLPIAVAVPFVTYFIYHIYYLSFVHFDYGYNMKANIAVGMLNSTGWLLWCFKNRHKKHIWKCAVSVVLINALLLLELGDFPPWAFVFDAHALWHLGTAPVPFLWYSFLMDDCLYVIKEQKQKQI